MTDGLELISGLDQNLPLPAQTRVFNDIDTLLDRAVESNDPMILMSGVRQLLRITRVSGLALSKLLHGAKQVWDKLETDGQEFRDVVFQETGLNVNTVSRYINVWEMLSSGVVPETLVEGLKGFPMRELVEVASLTSQGYELSEDDWKKISTAEDMSTMSSIIREIKGKPARKSSLQLFLDRNGDITAYVEGKPYLVGYLKLDDETPAVQKAIQRIIKSSGVIER